MRLMRFCAALALASTLIVSNAQGAVAHYQFDVPRGPLEQALRNFAYQSGLQIARFSDAGDPNTEVGPVSGNLTSEEALRRLLADSGLTYQVLSKRAIAIIKRRENDASAAIVRRRDDAPLVPPMSIQSVAGRAAHPEQVVINGSRPSIDESLAIKRAVLGVEEVMTAEAIGKLPERNAADVLQRVPGVNTQSTAAGAGGFDENNRVSMRGTGASLTQTTINGHSVATGDWFPLDQYQTVGRSVSFELLPSEIVQRTIVYKTQSADRLEGGAAGSVDLQTPKPLEFKPIVTASALLGGVYSDLPSKTQPQANALFNWQNGQMGILAIGFYEKRSSRRDGQEILPYNKVAPEVASAWRTANPSLPDATNAAYPSLIGQTLFNQTRKRAGGLIDFEVKPTDSLTLDLNGFYSRLDADNTNANFLFFANHIVNAQYIPTALTIAPNGTLVSGTWPRIPGAPRADSPALQYNSAVYDQVVRPSDSATYYVDLDAALTATDRLSLDAQVGFTRGVGNTNQESYVETQGGNGGSFTLHGINRPASIDYAGLNTADPTQFFVGFAFGDISHAIDKETYGQVNGLYKLDPGLFESIKFGARFSSHERDSIFPEKNGCNPGFCTPTSTLPVYDGGTYPTDYSKGIGGGGYPTRIYTYSPGSILAFDANALTHGPQLLYWPGEFRVKENDTALYVMTNFGGDGWSGNAGVRLVNTEEHSVINVTGGANPIGANTASGPYTPTLIKNDYFDILPSLNLKFYLAANLILRAATARSMSRPDYSALGEAVSLTDLTNTGIGGNARLRPVRSANYDTSLEWYYAPQALLEVDFFYMDMSSYVDFGNSTATYFNTQLQKSTPYSISSPLNTTAQVQGAELAWTQPLGHGFGATVNFTYADGKTGDGKPMVGNSRITYNAGAYYEAYGVSAHLDYTFRSHYLVGLDSITAENANDIGSLDAALNYTFSDNIGLSLNVLNITNQTIKYYAADTSQPRAFYTNGRQYYFKVRLRF